MLFLSRIELFWLLLKLDERFRLAWLATRDSGGRIWLLLRVPKAFCEKNKLFSREILSRRRFLNSVLKKYMLFH
jgi:hypothetical protein